MSPRDELLAHRDYIQGMARRSALGVGRANCDDVARDTLAVALERIERHQFVPGTDMKAWLRHIAYAVAARPVR